MSSVITTKNLSRHFQDGENIIKAVDDVSLNIEAGEFTAIIGPSGSGKSTLLNLIGGLDNPTSGAVELSGTDIAKMSGSALSDFRRDHIGFIFQSYNLIPVLSAEENIEYIMLLQGVDTATRKKTRKRDATCCRT
jgi:putative ABC transport system ATP-binding protein